jgi:C4-dicarboxylate-specific signal transduction histidine kinase
LSTADADSVNRQGERQFVGAVCASLSHEIKNCLAIINENAGLMGDLAYLAGRGRPVDPERQARIAATVQKQVRRADRLVGHLNRFAHCGDVDRRELDLAEAVSFVATLFQRTANKAGRRVLVTAGKDLKVETAPMGLLQLFWGILTAGTEGEGGADLQIRVEEGAEGFLVRIGPSSAAAASPAIPEALFDLARSLGGTLASTADSGLELHLPQKPAAAGREGA